MLARPSGLKLGKEAQAKFEEAKTASDFQGFLDKKGAKRKNWNNRWFVLKDNYLFYCKTTKTPPQGIINLHGCTVTQIEGPTARPYSFSLLAPKSVSVDAKWTNRTYFFAATSTGEMEEWIKILQESGRRSVERAQQKAGAAPQDAKKEKEDDSDEEQPPNEEEKKEKKKKKKKKKDTEEVPSETSSLDQSTEAAQEKKEKKKKKKKKKETSDDEEEQQPQQQQQESQEGPSSETPQEKEEQAKTDTPKEEDQN